jgi:poly-gamma-glutamate synthesis protein (capsule biosynthesis protein)
VLAYFVRLDGDTGRLISLEMVPFRSRRFRLQRVAPEDAAWLHKALDREGRKLSTRVELTADGVLCLSW